MLKLYKDYRMGDEPRYYLARKPEHLLRVPNHIRKCVVFLCAKVGEKEYHLGGTGFLMALAGEINFGYLLTAKQVIEAIVKASIDEKVHIRIDGIDGVISYISSSLGDWFFHHEDFTVDVAALPWLPTRKEYDVAVIRNDFIVGKDIREEENIGVGDEVFITGLFTRHFGEERNIPIVRTGNIATMPGEKVQTRYGKAVVYLIECRSIGGLSGSPVK
jgi:hypothetical protein